MSTVSPRVEADPVEASRTQIEFDDNLLLPALYGERDRPRRTQ